MSEYGAGSTGALSAEDWAEASRVASMDQVVKADQWVDWDGVTVQVDPMQHKLWLHDSNQDRHRLQENKGRFYDASDVRRLLNWETRHGHEPHAEYYTPSVATLNSIDPFPGPCASQLRWWNKGKNALDGKRPTISQMIFEGSLPDKSKGVIEAEVYQSDWVASSRLFSSGEAPGGASVGA